MAEKNPPSNPISDKDLNIPKEYFPQLDYLKSILLQIDEKKNSDEAASCKVEGQSEAKKSKASVKSQLASYKRELKDTKEEIERVKKALSAISDVREACLANFLSVKKEEKATRKENLPAILKETADTLPLWVGDNEAVPPLCGATQVDENYIAKAGDLVAAFVTVKGKKLTEWILAEVSDYNSAMCEYEVRDIEEKSLVYTLRRNKVIPLPTMRANPIENPDALFPKGDTILALYEGTTCFYKGIVHELPADAQKPYQIAFEDADCASGYSSPTGVPQRYVLAYKEFDSS